MLRVVLKCVHRAALLPLQWRLEESAKSLMPNAYLLLVLTSIDDRVSTLAYCCVPKVKVIITYTMFRDVWLVASAFQLCCRLRQLCYFAGDGWCLMAFLVQCSSWVLAFMVTCFGRRYGMLVLAFPL